MTRLPVRLALVASLMSATAAHAAIFTEDFENYTGTSTYATFAGALTPIGSFSPNWIIGGASTVDIVNTTGPGIGSVANQGNYWLDLNGDNSAGSITRYVGNLTAGQQYTLNFQYAANVGGGPLTAPGFTVSVNSTVFDPAFSNSSSSFNNGSVTFTAGPSKLAVITFASQGPATSYGAALDNISVAAVPEPHEWAMMLAGLGLVGWAARRRRGEQSGTGPMGAAA